MQRGESAAIAIGGLAAAVAAVFAVLFLLRSDLDIWAIPLLGLVIWRECALAGMRAELDQLRQLRKSSAR